MNGKYLHILDMPHHVSAARPHMTLQERAAQFAPFAALTGYSDEISETARLTDRRTEPDEDMKTVLDAGLRYISSVLNERPEVSITYFLPDRLKEGGAYVTAGGRVKKLDPLTRTLTFTDGTAIPIDEIRAISGEGIPEF